MEKKNQCHTIYPEGVSSYSFSKVFIFFFFASLNPENWANLWCTAQLSNH